MYVVYGSDLRIPYAATAFVSRRSVVAKLGVLMETMRDVLKVIDFDAHPRCLDEFIKTIMKTRTFGYLLWLVAGFILLGACRRKKLT